jgi:hypothetical protein
MKRLVPARVVVSVFSAAATAVAIFAILALTALTPDTARAAAPPAFRIGLQVTTTGTTNVRATADGKLLGTQPRFALGNVTAGPVTVGSNVVSWYQVSFVTGPSGWVGADMLVDGIATPKSVVVGKGTSQTMILDEFGNIEVGFNSVDANSNPTYSFTESTNQGLTFATPSLLPAVRFQVPAPQGPTIAAERNGAIDVVYPCLGTACPGHFGFQSVQLVRSIDHGVTWSAPVQLSLPTHPSGFGAQEPVIAACGAGVVVAWQDDGVGSNFSMINPDIIAVQVVNGVPGAPMNVTNTPGSEGHPQIAVNAQGNVYLTYATDDPNGGVNFAAIPNCAVVQN